MGNKENKIGWRKYFEKKTGNQMVQIDVDRNRKYWARKNTHVNVVVSLSF